MNLSIPDVLAGATSYIPRLQITRLEDVYPLSPWAKPAVEIMRQWMVPDSGHDEGHIVRVVRDALWFAQDGDRDVVIPAAVLHDLVNVPKSDKLLRSRASRLSAEKAIHLLKEILPFKTVGQALAIYHAIQAHSFSAGIEPLTIEAKAVQDADRLDSLGLIGISRCMAVSGVMGRTLFDPIDPLAENRQPDELAYGLDHFRTKLFKLAETMKTPLGRSLAQYRTSQMMTFYLKLGDEILGNDVSVFDLIPVPENVK